MGTWGVGSFDNDQALDWIGELKTAKDLSLIEQSLDIDAEDEDEYLDADLGNDIIAASEVLAALIGKPATDLPQDIATWVDTRRADDVSTLRTNAIRLLNAVLGEHSELRQLWQENKAEFPRWKQRIADLIDRLR